MHFITTISLVLSVLFEISLVEGTLVSSAQELEWALNSEDPHIIFTEHLDLREEAERFTKFLRLSSEVKSVTGACQGALPATFPAPPELQEQQCVLLMPTPDTLGIIWSKVNGNMWLHNILFQVVPVDFAKQTVPVLRTDGVPSTRPDQSLRMWISHTTLKGNAVDATTFSDGSFPAHVYMEGVAIDSFWRSASSTLSIDAGTLHMRYCTVANNSNEQLSSLISIREAYALFEGVTFANNTQETTGPQHVVNYYAADMPTALRVFTDGEAFTVTNSAPAGTREHKTSLASELPADARAMMSTLEDPWLLETVMERVNETATAGIPLDPFVAKLVPADTPVPTPAAAPATVPPPTGGVSDPVEAAGAEVERGPTERGSGSDDTGATTELSTAIEIVRAAGLVLPALTVSIAAALQ